jgi:hypothetical protein
MHKNVRLTLSFLSTIRYYPSLCAVALLNLVCCQLASLISERCGVSDASRAALAGADRREARAEPSAAFPATLR